MAPRALAELGPAGLGTACRVWQQRRNTMT